MIAKLHPVVVEPPSINNSKAVKGGDVVCGKESGAGIAHQAADGVYSKNIQGVVDMEEKFEFCGVIGTRGSEHAEDNGSPRRNKSYALLVLVLGI